MGNPLIKFRDWFQEQLGYGANVQPPAQPPAHPPAPLVPFGSFPDVKLAHEVIPPWLGLDPSKTAKPPANIFTWPADISFNGNPKNFGGVTYGSGDIGLMEPIYKGFVEKDRVGTHAAYHELVHHYRNDPKASDMPESIPYMNENTSAYDKSAPYNEQQADTFATLFRHFLETKNQREAQLQLGLHTPALDLNQALIQHGPTALLQSLFSR